jgi:hypothetical protein
MFANSFPSNQAAVRLSHPFGGSGSKPQTADGVVMEIRLHCEAGKPRLTARDRFMVTISTRMYVVRRKVESVLNAYCFISVRSCAADAKTGAGALDLDAIEYPFKRISLNYTSSNTVHRAYVNSYRSIEVHCAVYITVCFETTYTFMSVTSTKLL